MTSPSLGANPGVRYPWLLAGGGLLLVAGALSLFVGARTISPRGTFDAFFGGGERDHIIVREIRLPRTPPSPSDRPSPWPVVSCRA